MKLLLLLLEAEYYLLSTEDIKKGEVFMFNKRKILLAENDINVHYNKTHHRIIGATNEYNVKNEHGIMLLDKEKIQSLINENKINVRELAEEVAISNGLKLNEGFKGITYVNGFIEGYNYNKETVFTLADLKKAMEMMISVGREIPTNLFFDKTMVEGIINDAIKTNFSGQTEWEEIEVEMEEQGVKELCDCVCHNVGMTVPHRNQNCCDKYNTETRGVVTRLVNKPKVIEGYKLNILKIK
jgi:hypothetical protein